MNMDWLNGATQKEVDQFKAVCNQLLSRTYVVRTIYKPEKGRITNPDYTFLSIHYEHVLFLITKQMVQHSVLAN